MRATIPNPSLESRRFSSGVYLLPPRVASSTLQAFCLRYFRGAPNLSLLSVPFPGLATTHLSTLQQFNSQPPPSRSLKLHRPLPLPLFSPRFPFQIPALFATSKRRDSSSRDKIRQLTDVHQNSVRLQLLYAVNSGFRSRQQSHTVRTPSTLKLLTTWKDQLDPPLPRAGVLAVDLIGRSVVWRR